MPKSPKSEGANSLANIIVPISPRDWSNILNINNQKLPLAVFLDNESSDPEINDFFAELNIIKDIA